MNSLLKLYFVIIGIGQIFFVYEIYLIFNSLPIPNYIHLSNFVIGILIEIIMISILFMRLSNRILKYLLPLILIPVINIPLILTSMYFITKSKRIILILLPMLIANLIFQLITFLPPTESYIFEKISLIENLLIGNILSISQLLCIGIYLSKQ